MSRPGPRGHMNMSGLGGRIGPPAPGRGYLRALGRAGDRQHLAVAQHVGERVDQPVHGGSVVPRDETQALTLEVELHRPSCYPDCLVRAAQNRRLLPCRALEVVVLPKAALGNDDVVGGMAAELVETSFVLGSARRRDAFLGVVDLERDGRGEAVFL